MLDFEHFYDTIRGGVFGGKLRPSQVQGLEFLLDKWTEMNGWHNRDDRWFAYSLATATVETAYTMHPVMETQRLSDKGPITVDQAIRRLESSWARGRLKWVKKPYWRKNEKGLSYLGRGYVQLTHEFNYVNLTKDLRRCGGKYSNIDLAAQPDLAMDPDIAWHIMWLGMRYGRFTGRALGDFFPIGAQVAKSDWVGARKIINPGDPNAEEVARIGKCYYSALSYKM